MSAVSTLGWGSGDPQARVQRLSRLSAARRRQLAERCGAPYADAGSLIEHLEQPERAARLLPDLPPAAPALLRLMVEAQAPLPAALFDLAAEARVPDPEAREEAVAALTARGLLHRMSWAGGAPVVGLTPPLEQSLLPFFWALGEDPGDPEAPAAPAPRSPLPGLAALFSALATDAPRLSLQGEVHSADLTRLLQARFATPPAAPGEEAQRLFQMGALRSESSRARPALDRVQALFEAPPTEHLPLWVASDPPGRGRVAGLAEPRVVKALLLDGLRVLPEGRWIGREALIEAARLRLLATDASTPYGPLARSWAQARPYVQRALTAIEPYLERREGAGQRWLRIPPNAGPAGEGWVIQPNLEIVVPPEVRPAHLARLALIADLQRIDVVLTFSLGPRPTARAASLGISAATILRWLEAGSGTPLPEGLPLQVEGWHRQAPPPPQAGATHRHPDPLALPRFAPPSWPEIVEVTRAALRDGADLP